MSQNMALRRVRMFDRNPTASRAARIFVTEQLAHLGATPDVIGDFCLAVSELTANAVQYGTGDEVEVAVAADAEFWELEVSSLSADPDAISPPVQWVVSSPEETTGRGLGIVRSLMDHTDIRREGARVAVIARRWRRRRAG